MSGKRKKQPGHYCWVCGRRRVNENLVAKAMHSIFANGMYATTVMRERRQQRQAVKRAKK